MKPTDTVELVDKITKAHQRKKNTKIESDRRKWTI